MGESYIGLQILKNKIKINDTKLKNYFINRYYYPKPCLIGPKISKYINSMKDISDGFFGDLKKMLDNKYGAKIDLNKIPVSQNFNKLVKKNLINKKSIYNCGDNYDIIIISNNKFREKISSIAKKNNVKITRVGKVHKNLEILDDSNNPIYFQREYNHFL